jgi:dolichyl-phosphate-mannose--protein O-mannosyl transferase
MHDAPPSVTGRVARTEALCVFALCALFAAQAVWGMAQQGATFDETAHLPAGYSYLATNDHRLNPEHPPLAKLIAALPLAALPGLRFSTAWPEWQASDQFGFGTRFLYRDNAPARLLFWGRLPIVLITCLLGVVIWRWTRELAGRAAALSALGMFSFTPEFLAHGALVTTDAAVTAFNFAAFYAVFRATLRLTPWTILACGVAWGAALASKFSALVLAPVIILALLARAASAEPLVFAVAARVGVGCSSHEQRAARLGCIVGSVRLRRRLRVCADAPCGHQLRAHARARARA